MVGTFFYVLQAVFLFAKPRQIDEEQERAVRMATLIY